MDTRGLLGHLKPVAIDAKLLLRVVRGNVEAVKRATETMPGLIAQPNTASDYSGREFVNELPLKAALRLLDAKMCVELKRAYLRYHQEEGQAKFDQHFREVFPDGIETYVEQQKNNAFNFSTIKRAIEAATLDEVDEALQVDQGESPLFKALAEFRVTFDRQIREDKVFNPYHFIQAYAALNDIYKQFGQSDKLKLMWCKVIGYVQRYSPVNLADRYCQGFEDELINLHERQLLIENYAPIGPRTAIEFYPLDSDGKYRFGYNLAANTTDEVGFADGDGYWCGPEAEATKYLSEFYSKEMAIISLLTSRPKLEVKETQTKEPENQRSYSSYCSVQ